MTRADEVFDTEIVTFDGDRKADGERLQITIGFASGRMVVIVWTARESVDASYR